MRASKKIFFILFAFIGGLIIVFLVLELGSHFISIPERDHRDFHPSFSFKKDHALVVSPIDLPVSGKKFQHFPSEAFIETFDVFEPLASGYSFLRKSHVGGQGLKLKKNNKTIFSAKYSFDQYRRRITDFSSRDPKQHIILLGCSFTFGEGLMDGETLASQLQKLDKASRYYNLARPGGSVVDVIISQQLTKMWDHIEPTEGLVLFNFSSNMHMRRFLGTMRIVGDWNQRGGFLYKNGQEYQFGGVYLDDRPLWTFLSQMLSKSHFLEVIGFDWPVINEQAYDDYALAIRQSKEFYQMKYGQQNKFFVFLRPGETQAANIIPFLEKYKIQYLDYSKLDLEIYAQASLEIPYDGHPSAEYNRLLARQIHRDLIYNCVFKSHCLTSKSSL